VEVPLGRRRTLSSRLLVLGQDRRCRRAGRRVDLWKASRLSCIRAGCQLSRRSASGPWRRRSRARPGAPIRD